MNLTASIAVNHMAFTLYFGAPGCGKTTLACKLLFDARRKNAYEYYYANFETSLANYVSLKGLGEWSFPPNSLIIIDESGIEYNSRKYKALPVETIEWFKTHRHYTCDVIFISQSWEDNDCTIRRLYSDLYLVKKLFCFTLVRRIYPRVDIDKNTHQIIYAYKFGSIFGNLVGANNFRLFCRNWYYRYFDSFSVNPKVTILEGKKMPSLDLPFLHSLRFRRRTLK